MITISTRCYTTEQLKDLLAGLDYAAKRIYENPECQKYADYTTAVKHMQYAMTYAVQDNTFGKR